MLTPAALREALAQHSGEGFIYLLTISHPDIATLRVALNNEDVTSRGEIYMAGVFRPQLATNNGEELPTAEVAIDNVDRRIAPAVVSLAGRTKPFVTLDVVTLSDPNTVEIGPLNFRLTRSTISLLKVVGSLQYENVLSESFPSGEFTPAAFRGLFN